MSLCTLHSVSLAHRDVKIENYLMDTHSHCALIDLGLSVFRDGSIVCPSCHKSCENHSATCSYRQWKCIVCSMSHPTVSCSPIPEIESLFHYRDHDIGSNDRLTSNAEYHVTSVNSGIVGTRGYKAPELLMQWPDYTSSIDIWSAGIVILNIMCGNNHLFNEINNILSIHEIEHLVGKDEMIETAHDIHAIYEVTLTRPACASVIQSSNTDRHIQLDRLHAFVCQRTKYVYPESLYRLLSVMLEPNPYRRISARLALLSNYIVSDTK